MKTRHNNTPRIAATGLAAAILLALAACGGGGGSGSTPPVVTPPVVAPPVVMLDAFFRTVQAAIGMAPDNTEPADISAVAVTAPEQSEPEKTE